MKSQGTYELLARSLLDLPSQPAIIYVQYVETFACKAPTDISSIFALQFDTIGFGADMVGGQSP